MSDDDMREWRGGTAPDGSTFTTPADRVAVVDHPPHYGGDTPYETIKVLEAWLTPEQYVGFLRGNALKYLSRAGQKNDVVEDLEKARWYVQREIDTRRS